MPQVLLITSGIFHPSLPGRLALRRDLAATPGVRLRHARSIEALAQTNLAALDAVVLYYHRHTISPRALDALDRFVRRGGGILAVHSATASFKQSSRYFDILGGRFIGHPPVGPLEIRPAVSADEIFGPIPPFVVTDEAYRHELRDIRVHFVARSADRRPLTGDRGVIARPVVGAEAIPSMERDCFVAQRAPGNDDAPDAAVPFVWTRQHGAGRVCYVAAGHCAGSLRHPSIVHILQVGLAWVCRSEGEAVS